jgi:hypothetical protein
MPRELTPDELTELRALLAAGSVIEAIKHYRSLTGAGLTEAKIFVDALLVPAQANTSLPPELLDLCVERRCLSGDRSAIDERLRLATAQYGEAARQAAGLAAERMVLGACKLVEECRNGHCRQADLPALLAAEHPGFGAGAYSRAVEYGFVASR